MPIPTSLADTLHGPLNVKYTNFCCDSLPNFLSVHTFLCIAFRNIRSHRGEFINASTLNLKSK